MSATAKPQNVAVWFEIPAADFERAVGFYERIFDTRLRREKFGAATTPTPAQAAAWRRAAARRAARARRG